MLNLALLGGLWARMQKKKRRSSEGAPNFVDAHPIDCLLPSTTAPTVLDEPRTHEKCRPDYTTPATISPRLSTMQCSVHSYPRQSRRVYGTGINRIREADG